jgi:hypothetical protein
MYTYILSKTNKISFTTQQEAIAHSTYVLCKGKVKDKGRLWLLQHCCLLWHIVILPERVPSFIYRGAAHTKQRERPLLEKEGIIPGI